MDRGGEVEERVEGREGGAYECVEERVEDRGGKGTGRDICIHIYILYSYIYICTLGIALTESPGTPANGIFEEADFAEAEEHARQE